MLHISFCLMQYMIMYIYLEITDIPIFAVAVAIFTQYTQVYARLQNHKNH